MDKKGRNMAQLEDSGINYIVPCIIVSCSIHALRPQTIFAVDWQLSRGETPTLQGAMTTLLKELHLPTGEAWLGQAAWPKTGGARGTLRFAAEGVSPLDRTRVRSWATQGETSRAAKPQKAAWIGR